ncbi:hypothetical protein NE237_032516 [Protea cynaroides]|uniref:Uncharacterized protein n=1 Tax=Protea cynaroides TaxID=273540 RepID=A0A9Q0L3I2_9MAGN|nr:hypothetical protein NE237_032516 [Protea cynaroides]
MRCRGVLRGHVYSVMPRCRVPKSAPLSSLLSDAEVLRSIEVRKSAPRLGFFGHAEVLGAESGLRSRLLDYAEVYLVMLRSAEVPSFRGVEECSAVRFLYSLAVMSRSALQSGLLDHASAEVLRRAEVLKKVACSGFLRHAEVPSCRVAEECLGAEECSMIRGCEKCFMVMQGVEECFAISFTRFCRGTNECRGAVQFNAVKFTRSCKGAEEY